MKFSGVIFCCLELIVRDVIFELGFLLCIGLIVLVENVGEYLINRGRWDVIIEMGSNVELVISVFL